MIRTLDLIRPLKISGKSEVWECRYNGQRAVAKMGTDLKSEYRVLKQGGPGLPALLLWDFAGDKITLVREWVDGRTMAELCKQGTWNMSPAELVSRLAVFMEGLKNGDGEAFIHGDISPDNIILSGNDVRLVDFENAGWGESTTANGFKREFVAPEVLTSGRCSVQGDMYSMGRTLKFCGLWESWMGPLLETNPVNRPKNWQELIR